MKVVINRCFGGFGLSNTARNLYAEDKGLGPKVVYDFELSRTDPDLVRIVEELGDKADGPHASLKVVEIPDGVEWHIHEYDGYEYIAENHRTWS